MKPYTSTKPRTTEELAVGQPVLVHPTPWRAVYVATLPTGETVIDEKGRRRILPAEVRVIADDESQSK